MAITATNIKDALNSRLSVSETTTTLEDYIQETLVEISQLANWPSMLTTADCSVSAAGDETVDAPTGMKHWKEVYIDGDRRLELGVHDEIRYAQEEQATQGKPFLFSFQGSKIFLWYVPDDTYTLKVRYYQIHPDHTGGSGILFPDKFKEAIICRTCEKYLDGNPKEMTPERNAFLRERYSNKYREQITLLMPGADMEVAYVEPTGYLRFAVPRKLDYGRYR